MREAFRGAIYHCVDDPGESGRTDCSEYFDDGILVVEDGSIAEVGPAASILQKLGDTPITDFSDKLILPGLIDCHVHFPQLDIIASYGKQLLDWLERYAYPAEMRFADVDYARDAAAFFLDELLANGTTTAAVFATVHAHSADVLFEAAAERDMRLIAGKVLMDRNCPKELRDTAGSAYTDSKALIEKWHGNGRLGYAITPRFALTSSDAQLDAAGKLAAEYPDTWVHTHLSENHAEIEAVASEFPDRANYLDVYDHAGLVRERSIFAHCLHLDTDERDRLAECGGAIAFCPTSNLFLGSGLFDLRAMTAARLRVGIGSDVGGGTSLSLLQTLGEGYKALQLQHQTLPPARALYLATLGGARALYLDDRIGDFAPGKEADFIVVDPAGSRLSERRLRSAADTAESLFALLYLGDERHVAATYVNGRPRAA
ncbi:MAG: guanine deaminase [Woeseiaceae bacterium]|nr:guanine deaminase [Woeseiaceae bacterium]